MTLCQAARFYQRVAERLPQAVTDAVQLTVDDALEVALRLSDGPLSRRDLRRLGHPYARRHGGPRLNPAIINVQSSAFRAAWRKADAAPAGNDIRGRIWNDSDHARYLYDPEASEFPDGGTELAFGRPLPKQIVAEVFPRYRLRMAVAIERAFRR